MKNRGFTLLELLVGTAVSCGIVACAVALVTRQTRAIKSTTERVEISEAARIGLEMLASDLRIAGAGIGYSEAGGFGGLLQGTFQVGVATFAANNFMLQSGARTDDISVLAARGDLSSIIAFDPAGTVDICAGGTYTAGDIALLRSEDGLSARSVRLGTISNVACTGDVCASGCQRATWTADASWPTDPSSLTATYAGGSLSGSVGWVTWFVEDSRGIPVLRRAEGACARRDSTCGAVVAELVETIQLRRWAHSGGVWTDITATTTPLPRTSRLRIDVELVVRSRMSIDESIADRTTASLETNECYPDCAGSPDRFQRRRVATSVEVKNAGRVTYGRAR